jgi:proteasome lid subunit RPN8/RPN11
MTLNKENKEYYKHIISHALKTPEEEVCGIISLNNSLIVNVSPELNLSIDKKNNFEVSSKAILNTKNILGIYHSHPFTDEQPSEYDKANSEELGIPFLIYSLITEKFFLYIPNSLKPAPLSGRPYVKGFYECVNIPRDWYSTNCKWFNLDYSLFNYFPSLNGIVANKYMLKIFDNNFLKIKNTSDVRQNDTLIFKMPNEDVFHAGICSGTDRFFHQKAHHLSGEDMIDSRWQKKIIRIYRPIS